MVPLKRGARAGAVVDPDDKNSRLPYCHHGFLNVNACVVKFFFKKTMCVYFHAFIYYSAGLLGCLESIPRIELYASPKKEQNDFLTSSVSSFFSLKA